MDNNINSNTAADEDALDENEDIDIDEDINSQSDENDEESSEDIDSEELQSGKKTSGNDKTKKKFSESIRAMAQNFKDWWLNIPRRTKMFSIGTAVFTLFVIVVIFIAVSTGRYVIAASGTTDTEAAEILTILRDNKIKYKYNNALGTIAVKEKDLANIVMLVAEEEALKEGYFFEPVQSTGMFMTDADKRREEEENNRRLIETAINSIDGVSHSIALIKYADNKNNILKKEQQQSSAAVTIFMESGKTLSAKSVQGIETLLLRAIPDITPENISVHDSTSALLNGVVEEEDTSEMDSREFLYNLKRQFHAEQEQNIFDKVSAMMVPAFGEENFTLSVHVDSNFDAWIEEQKVYTGPNVNEITGEMYGMTVGEAFDRYVSSGSDSEVIGGVVGTDWNIDDPGYLDTLADPEESAYSDDTHWTRERLVDEVFRQLEHNTPDLNVVTLALTVNRPELDPDYEENLISALGNASGATIYARRDAAAADVEFDTEFLKNYITVFPTTYYNPAELIPVEGGLPGGLTPFQLILIAALILAILILLVVVLIMLLRKKKYEEEEEGLLESPQGEGLGELRAALAHRTLEEETTPASQDIKSPASRERMLKNQIKVFTDQNTEIAAQLIKTLLKEEGQ